MNAIVVLPSAPKALEHLGRLKDEIDKAPSLEVVEAIADAAAGYQRMFKPVKEVADRAGEVWVKAESRIGTELAKMPKAKGARGQIKGQKTGKGRGKGGGKGASTGGATIEPPVDDAAKLADLGVTKKRATRAKKIAALSDEKREEVIENLKAQDKAITPNAVLAEVRREAKQEKKQAAIEAVFSETGPFDVVVIDPPWPMQKVDREERPNQAAFDYDVMTLDELKTFWGDNIAATLKDDVHVFCWTTEKYLPAAITLIEQWDLRYVLTMVWHKEGGFQPHDLPQYNAEFIIYARKGTPLFVDTKNFFVCNSWPRREHSRKPKEFYELIARVTGGSRLDVFAREKHPGFAQFGKEPEKFEKAS